MKKLFDDIFTFQQKCLIVMPVIIGVLALAKVTAEFRGRRVLNEWANVSSENKSLLDQKKQFNLELLVAMKLPQSNHPRVVKKSIKL